MPVKHIDYEAPAVRPPLVKLVKQTDEPRPRIPGPTAAPPKRIPPGQAGQEKISPRPPQAKKVEAQPINQSAKEQPSATPGQVIQPEEPIEDAAPPEQPGTADDFKNRFDAAQNRLSHQAQNTDELPALLDRVLTVLESLSRLPAIRDYSANQRKLEEIEQRLSYGSYPQ